MSVKTAGVGHFTIPTAPAAGTSCTSGAANVFTTTYVQLIAATAAALYITGLFVESATALGGTYDVVQLATGAAASEVIIGQYLIALSTGATIATGYRPIFPPIPVAISTRIACKTADSVGAKATLITLECIAQSNVVDDAIPVTTVTTVTNQLTAAAIATAHWQDTTAGDFTTALSVGKSIMNGVALGTGLTINAYTGNTVQTGDAFAIVNNATSGNVALNADTEEIIATLGAAGAGLTAIPTIATVTTLTNLPSIPANWLTAAGINAAALNGKGDWNIGKTGYALSAAGVQAIWDALTSALPTVGSIGKLIVDNLNATISSRSTYAGGDTSGTTTLLTRVPALVPVASDYTAARAAKLDDLDATVSSRSTYAGTDTAGTTTLLSRLGSPVGASISADVAGVPAATLAAATATPIAADVKKINATTVNGNGAGTPWGP